MPQTPQTQYEQELNALLSVPRRFGGLGNLAANRLAQQFQQLRRRVQTVQTGSGAAVVVNPTLPKQVLSVSATQTASKQQDRTFSLVSVSFTRDASDPNFAGVRIWFKGYKGNTQWELMASGSDSPVSFLEEATGETVQVAVQAFNQSGFAAPFSGAPITPVTLNGVTSAPPAPTVSQTVVPVVAGFQFTFTLEAGLLADVIDSYKVYRNTVNNSGTATVCQTIKHPQSNNGSYVVQDYPGGDSVYFYWVSAVNTMGLESSLTAAQSSTQMALTTQKAFGKNLCPNPGFEFNAVGAPSSDSSWSNTSIPSPVCDGWYLASDTSSNYVAGLTNTLGRNASKSLVVRLPTNTSIPSDNTFHECRILTTNKIPVATGDLIRCGGYMQWASGVSFPAGVTGIQRIGFFIYAADGTGLGEVNKDISAVNNAYVWNEATLQIPNTLSGKTPSYIVVECCAFVKNNSGSTFNTGSNLYQDLQWDDIKVVTQMSAFDLTPVSTSGTLTGANPLSQSGTTTTINVAGSTMQFGDGTVAYNSGSVNPGSYGTWYVYASDPTYSGGAVTYLATSSYSATFSANGYVLFGKITTAGGGGGTGSGGGSGGGRVPL